MVNTRFPFQGIVLRSSGCRSGRENRGSPVFAALSLQLFALGSPRQLSWNNASQGAGLTVLACAEREWVWRERRFVALSDDDPA
jgi:hypothetical protein